MLYYITVLLHVPESKSFLLTAGTDARRFTDVADSILRFAPIDLDKAQYASIHGANEHIKIQNIGLSGCICCAMRLPSAV